MKPEDLLKRTKEGYGCGLCGFRTWDVDACDSEPAARQRMLRHITRHHLQPIRREATDTDQEAALRRSHALDEQRINERAVVKPEKE